MIDPVAPGVELITGRLKYAWNCYLLEERFLVDTGPRWAGKELVRRIGSRTLEGIIITHAHPDHQGSAAYIKDKYNAPVMCGTADKVLAENREWPRVIKNRFIARMIENLTGGGPFAVDRVLNDGEMLGEFVVIELPGHTPGHIGLFRESDRLLILGDALLNVDPLKGKTQLRLHFKRFIHGYTEYLESLKKIRDLKPEIICFSHGKVIRDRDRLLRFIDQTLK